MVRAMLRLFGGEAGVAIRAAFRRFLGRCFGVGEAFFDRWRRRRKIFCKNGLKTIDIVS